MGITSCIAHTIGIVHRISNATVSFPAFLEVAGQQFELLLCEYVAICEVVDEVGRINAFVYADSRFRLTLVLGVYDKVLRYRKFDSRITYLQG